MDNVTILNESEMFSQEQIEKLENHYKSKYVFESCIKDLDGHWINRPMAIFYSRKKHPQGSNYFAIYYDSLKHSYFITDALSATESFTGLMIDGKVIYSRYRHDCRKLNGVFIDGGRDYARRGGERMLEAEWVTIKVNKDKLEIKE